MKRVEELDVALGRLQRERVDARAVFADPIDPSAIQFDDTLVAAADVEDVGESAVLLFKGDELIAMNAICRSRRPDDEHDAHAIHIHILKEWRPGARLEDIQVLGVEVFRMRMSEMWARRRRRGEHDGLRPATAGRH